MASSQRTLEDKVAIVTGSSSGIGEAIAIEYVRHGALVTLNGRNVELLEAVEKKCSELAGGKEKVLVVVGDLTDEVVRIRLIEETLQKFGKIDILVNNAGFYAGNCLSYDFELNRLDQMLDIHVRVPFHLTKLVIPHLIKTQGNILNISSVAGMRALDSNNVEYSVAKAGMDHLTRIAALELASKNVRVNGISPGGIETPMQNKTGIPPEELPQLMENVARAHALGRIGRTEEISSAALYLASGGASFITGVMLPVEGGLMLKSPFYNNFPTSKE